METSEQPKPITNKIRLKKGEDFVVMVFLVVLGVIAVIVVIVIIVVNRYPDDNDISTT